MKIQTLKSTNYVPELEELLRDSVADGASVGFIDPIDNSVASSYWADVFADIEAGHRILKVALDGAGEVQGAVQLSLCMKPNGRHRVEVEKLMVHSRARRAGIGRALMQAAEQAASNLGRNLVVLDTSTGSDASFLYRSLGYIAAGQIPVFALNSEGHYDGTTIFYKQIGPLG